MVYNWLINSLSAIIPPRCHLCDAPGKHLCADCQADLPTRICHCRRCGVALEMDTLARFCGACLQSPPHFQLTLSPYTYHSPLSHLIMALKYQRRLSLVPVLAGVLAEHIEKCEVEVDALLPVPLHTSKLRQRGFNQALELARPLARQFGLPILHQLERHRATQAQSSLHADARQQNVRNAFRIKQPFDYRRVAIIDDVMTTGSTVNEIARLLKNAGVEEIQIWCVARA